ncbi:hypothetical protein [Nocardia sp. NPDC049149]|uniref:hypothetical protein n=1 Tax=Nocardia sp. NPDC049149 TaxID=3364315 RepID=UPI003721DE9D
MTVPLVGIPAGGEIIDIPHSLSTNRSLYSWSDHPTGPIPAIGGPVHFGGQSRNRVSPNGFIDLLLRHHGVAVRVGVSDRAIPLPFIIEESVTDVTEAEVRGLQDLFALPDLSATDDRIANGTAFR